MKQCWLHAPAHSQGPAAAAAAAAAASYRPKSQFFDGDMITIDSETVSHE